MAEFNDVLVRCLPRLRRFAGALVDSHADAEDLLHSAIEYALLSQEKWRNGSKIELRMFAAMQTLWMNGIKQQRRRPLSLDLAMQMPGEDGRLIADRRFEIEAVRQAMRSMRPEQRTVMALVIIDGLSYQDAASALDVPVGTVMSRLHRGRTHLCKALGQRFRPKHEGPDALSAMRV